MNQLSDELNILRYIQKKRILIADASVATRTTIINILKELGARWTDIQQVADLASAEERANQLSPDIVIFDPGIGENSLGLIRRMPVTCLTIVVSRNASSASVAEAIEAGADYYVVKPFTTKSFREYFIHAALTDSISNPRDEEIEKGLSAWGSGDLIKAQAIFSEVASRDENSLFARFYLGQLLHERGDTAGAIAKFEAALSLSPNNFRCLLGLFDALLAAGEKSSAYEIAKRIFKSYPLSRKRLEEILDLAMEMGRFEEADLLYKNYVDMDARNQALAEKMALVLVHGAEISLQKGDTKIGSVLMRRALISSGRSLEMLRKIIEILLEKNETRLATEFLAEIPAEQKLDPESRALAFLVTDAAESPEYIFEAGVKLVRDGVLHPDIHRILIKRAKSLGKTTFADQLEHEAKQRWPEAFA